MSLGEQSLGQDSGFHVGQENINFIRNLTGKESIGVDKQGRLYKTGPLRSLFHLFSSFQPTKKALYDSLSTMAKDRNFLQGKADEFKLRFDIISKMKILSPTDKDQIAEIFYRNRLAVLKENHPELIAEAMAAVEMNLDPNISAQKRAQIAFKPTTGGTSGSYFIKNLDGKVIGVFKPRDEEIFMPNNPKGRTANYKEQKPQRIGPKEGHEQGISFKKEVAAYLIDQGEHANVPYTTEITLSFPLQPGVNTIIPKQGSIQEFVKGTPVEDLTADEIDAIPNVQVQKVALFDLLVGNSDRNPGNILWNDKSQELTPIDHGLILLDSMDWHVGLFLSETSCQWLSWQQVKEPTDSSLKEWILNMDIDSKCQTLKASGIAESSLREFKMRAIFIKTALEKGFTLYEIGMMCMQNAENISSRCLLDQVSQSAVNTLYKKYGGEVTDKESEFYASYLEKTQEALLSLTPRSTYV